PPPQALPHLPRVIHSPEQAAAWLKGQAVAGVVPDSSSVTSSHRVSPAPQPLECVQVCHRSGQFLGIGYWREPPLGEPHLNPTASATLQPKVVFN
ncbi:MAG: tRNA pseudouridine(55) synthase TruB, partial [Leptolyngbyaceae cyanobacterium]